jgi:hypothetical protein
MLELRLYCPSCKEPLYEYDFQLEGELSGPESGEPVACQVCGWHGSFGELCDAAPGDSPPELDFQI